MKVKIKPFNLYKYSAGIFCGVFVKEPTMRKIAKLQSQYLHEIKKLLISEFEKGNVFSYSWTLHHPEGNQTTVYFSNPDEDVLERIEVATTGDRPKHRPLVFEANSMDQAAQMADAHFEGKDEF